MVTNAAPAAAAPTRSAARPAEEPPRIVLYPLSWQIIGAAALILGSGILHFVYAPLHVSAARGQGFFFLILGFVQVGWGAAVLRNPSPRSYLVGMTVASVMPALLYVVTRSIAGPFSDEAEGVDIVGATTFVAETLGAVLLAWHGVAQGIEWRSPDIRPIALVALLVGAGVLFAAIFFATGLGLEAAVPWLNEGETTGHHGNAAGGDASEDHHAATTPRLLTSAAASVGDGKLQVHGPGLASMPFQA